MAFQSQVGAMVLSTRAVPFPRISAGVGAQAASTCAMTGRIRSQRRDTVDCEQPKMSPASSWVMLVRIRAVTIATDLNSPATAGRPPGRAASPMTPATRAASSASCPRLSPVRVSYRNGSSTEFPCLATRDSMAGTVLISSVTRRKSVIHRLICGYVDNANQAASDWRLMNRAPGSRHRRRPPGVFFGWKNFYIKDHSMLSPRQTMARIPQTGDDLLSMTAWRRPGLGVPAAGDDRGRQVAALRWPAGCDETRNANTTVELRYWLVA